MKKRPANNVVDIKTGEPVHGYTYSDTEVVSRHDDDKDDESAIAARANKAKRQSDLKKYKAQSLSKLANHDWEFLPVFRRHAFGWRSQTAISLHNKIGEVVKAGLANRNWVANPLAKFYGYSPVERTAGSKNRGKR